MSMSDKFPEPQPTRRPIAGVRISTVALVGIFAAIAIPAGAAALVLSGGLDGHHTTVHISQTGPISKVVVNDAEASVRVIGDPTLSGVSGTADLNWHGSSQTPPLRLDQSLADGVLTLSKVCLRSDECGGADITIKVPTAVAVQATTSDGGIDVSDVTGGVDLQTSNAGISGDRLGSGNASMHTSNGGIDVSFSGAPKSIRAITSNAGVDITTDGKTAYYDDVDTSNGSLSAKNVRDQHTENVIYIRTSNASISVK
ncbi:MAG: DUF4097 family beta strand repeat protein [Catenulispora sp.]|nr:DUF4097 family beta strand repeat protein [Catenulispora sp.]